MAAWSEPAPRRTSGSARGIQRERAVLAHYRDAGYIAFRAPASLGVADVVAMRAGEKPKLVEVKSTHRGPFHSFGPAARYALIEAAEKAGAEALLAWWPPRGQLRVYGVDEWPS